jgi:MHS family alpha-ketoglutarate permease-like MFS transporter
VNTSGFDKAVASQIMTVALMILLLLQPLVGRLSDFTGRRPVMMTFGICGTLFTYPIFTAIAHTQSVATAFALVMAGLVMLTGYTSINAIVKAELFPADIRALGVALPYALANTIFGGTAEYVALWLKNAGHEPWFYIYISLLSAIYLICVLRMRETQATSRILED